MIKWCDRKNAKQLNILGISELVTIFTDIYTCCLTKWDTPSGGKQEQLTPSLSWCSVIETSHVYPQHCLVAASTYATNISPMESNWMYWNILYIYIFYLFILMFEQSRKLNVTWKGRCSKVGKVSSIPHVCTCTKMMYGKLGVSLKGKWCTCTGMT